MTLITILQITLAFLKVDVISIFATCFDCLLFRKSTLGQLFQIGLIFTVAGLKMQRPTSLHFLQALSLETWI